MHEKHIKAIEAVAPVVTPVVKTVANHQMQLRQQREQRDIQLEIAEKKQELQEKSAQKMREIESAERDESESQGTDTVMELMEDEDCTICKKMLRVIDGYEGERREIALAEYGELKGVMERADDESEVKEFIEGSRVLDDTLEEAM